MLRKKPSNDGIVQADFGENRVILSGIGDQIDVCRGIALFNAFDHLLISRIKDDIVCRSVMDADMFPRE